MSLKSKALAMQEQITSCPCHLVSSSSSFQNKPNQSNQLHLETCQVSKFKNGQRSANKYRMPSFSRLHRKTHACRRLGSESKPTRSFACFQGSLGPLCPSQLPRDRRPANSSTGEAANGAAEHLLSSIGHRRERVPADLRATPAREWPMVSLAIVDDLKLREKSIGIRKTTRIRKNFETRSILQTLIYGQNRQKSSIICLKFA